MLPLSAFTMYLGYARTHSDELAVLKPKKRDLYLELELGAGKASSRAAGQPGSWAAGQAPRTVCHFMFGFVHSEELGVVHFGRRARYGTV